MQVGIGAFLPEPPSGQAWIGTSAEFWEWPWELEQWVLHLAEVGKFTGPASAGVGWCLSILCYMV